MAAWDCFPSEIISWKDTSSYYISQLAWRPAQLIQHLWPLDLLLAWVLRRHLWHQLGGKTDKIIKPHELKGELIPLYRLLFLLFLGNFRCVNPGLFFFSFVTGLIYSSTVFFFFLNCSFLLECSPCELYNTKDISLVYGENDLTI